jgi:hypothetical protein
VPLVLVQSVSNMPSKLSLGDPHWLFRLSIAVKCFTLFTFALNPLLLPRRALELQPPSRATGTSGSGRSSSAQGPDWPASCWQCWERR